MSHEFLRSLKPGDRVGVSQRYDPYIAIVVRVTKSGQIVVQRELDDGSISDCQTRFGNSGRELGVKWGAFLTAATEMEERIKDDKRRRANGARAHAAIDLLNNGRAYDFTSARKAEILALIQQLEVSE